MWPFFSETMSVAPSREELTVWERKQVMFVAHIGVKTGAYRIICYSLMPVYNTFFGAHHICCFYGHICNACHSEVKPQFLFVDFSSWFPGTIKDFQCLDKFVDFFFEAYSSSKVFCHCCLYLPFYHSGVWFIYTVNHHTIKHQCQKCIPCALQHREAYVGL